MFTLERRSAVEQVLDGILDPCSVAVGAPTGLVAMGLIDDVELRGDDVVVRLRPTMPGCLYTAVFAGEICRSLGELDWIAGVSVEVVADGTVWDEDRMAPAAREKLEQARAERRNRLLPLIQSG